MIEILCHVICFSLSLLPVHCSVLSRCSHAVLALLYPFTWQHTFVPVLPASMLDISCSPTPFLIGVLTPCLPEVLELPIEEVRRTSVWKSLSKFEVLIGRSACAVVLC